MGSFRLVNWRRQRRYGPFVMVAAIILIFQAFLIYNFCKMTLSEDSAFGDNHRESDEKEMDGNKEKNTIVLSGEKRRPIDDEISDDEGLPSNVFGGSKVVIRSSDAVWPAAKVSNNVRVVAGNTTRPRPLSVDDLGFVPSCDITAKDAISALTRAKSTSCKKELVDVVCRSQRKQLYPERLPHLCPSKGRALGEYLGCYADKKEARLLTGHMNKSVVDNSPQQCLDLCLQSGFLLAGVQYGTECFCGDTFPSLDSKLPETNCDIKCPGNGSETCGGYFTMNIYHTGLSKTTKPNLAPISGVQPFPVRIVYLLTLNGRAVRQVRRLVRAIYHVDSYIYIHVDSRQDYLFRELLPLEDMFPNVRLSRQRFATIWGGASLLQMILQCLMELLELRPDWKWDFLVNLSESDFPVKTHSDLVSFLSVNRNKNFLKSHGRDTRRFIAKQGLDKIFHECDTHMWRLGERELPLGIRVDGGSDWTVLSRSFCEYVIRSKDTLVTGLKALYRYTLLPAESFFHTVLRNSKMCDSFVDNNLHLTNWKRKIGCRCQYRHVVDWCGCSPNDFHPEDWSRIRAADSKPYYFARKFEPSINQRIIDQLESWLYGPTPSDRPGLASYWQNEYHFADKSPLASDAFLTVYHSFARLSIHLLGIEIRECITSANQVHEATLYFESDSYKGTLIRYVAEVKGETFPTVMETLAHPRNLFKMADLSGKENRLKSLQVGTDYDQKEQVFRNFARIMGPHSEPSLVHRWGDGEALAVTFVWVDPVRTVAGSYEVKVESGSQVGMHKPVFQTPLRPGIWIVKMFTAWELVAQTQFLVVPLAFKDGKAITVPQARIYNNGPLGGSYVDHDFASVEKLLRYKDHDTLLHEAQANSLLNGPALWKWIDGLVSRFYTIQDSCYTAFANAVYGNVSCYAHTLDPCQGTTWSSISPDKKSEVGSLDRGTGRLIN